MTPEQRAELIDQLDRSFTVLPTWAKTAVKRSMGAPEANTKTGRVFTSFREVIEAASDETLEILKEEFRALPKETDMSTTDEPSPVEGIVVEKRKFVCYFYCNGADLSFGISVSFTEKNVEIYVPFGFFRIGLGRSTPSDNIGDVIGNYILYRAFGWNTQY